MAKWIIALGITAYVAWYFFSYDAGVLVKLYPKGGAVDMGIWKE